MKARANFWIWHGDRDVHIPVSKAKRAVKKIGNGVTLRVLKQEANVSTFVKFVADALIEIK